jgi:Uma2 family endonuclease
MPATSKRRLHFEIGRRHNGILMTPEEFDAIDDYDDNYRYELINGVLVVNPMPSVFERDPNEELGYWLRYYSDQHPGVLNKTVFEEYINTRVGRRRADRVIWAGLEENPDPEEDVPTIVVEFVSRRKRDQIRDYIDKRDEYLEIGVAEYWIVNRFQGTMTVFRRAGGGIEEHVVSNQDIYTTALLPGFELPLGKLLALCDSWPKKKTKAKKKNK